MSRESDLQERVRELIKSGILPDQHPGRLHGRRGSGTDCKVCDEVLARHQFELVLEFDGERMGSGVNIPLTPTPASKSCTCSKAS